MLKKAQVGPYQQKTQWSCSAACLKAVLAHYGVQIPEIHAIQAVGAKPKRGAECNQIAEAARKLGFDSFEYSFDSIDQAKILLDQDIPIICDIQSFNFPGKGHYVVLVAADENTVQLMDPNTPGNIRTISRQEMEDRWWDRAMVPPHDVMMKWGIVILPPGDEMKKTAFNVGGTAGKLKNLWNNTSNANKGMLLGGVPSAGLGAVLGSRPKMYDARGKKVENKHRVFHGVMGALNLGTLGAIAGHGIGTFKDISTEQKRWQRARQTWQDGGYSAREARSAPGSGAGMPDWLKGSKNKADAKIRYRAAATQHHPDRGGNEEKMKQINADWDKWQGFWKEAMLRAFSEELVKIAQARK
jgi:predicted double-glycine peptidase